MVMSMPAMRETWVRSLGWEDPLEEGMVTHSSILAWRILMDRGAWQATIHEVTKSWTLLSNEAQHVAHGTLFNIMQPSGGGALREDGYMSMNA